MDDRYAGLSVFGEAKHVVLPVWSQAETECDKHDQAEGRVAERGPHHGRRQHTRGVFELFRHVRAGVRAEEAPEGGGDTHEAGKAGRGPAAVVFEVAEHLRGRCVLAHSPKDDEEGEEAEDMHDQKDTFGKGELLRKEDVERYGSDEKSHDEERGLPELGEVGIWVFEINEALDEHGGQLRGGRAASDPTKGAGPSN